MRGISLIPALFQGTSIFDSPYSFLCIDSPLLVQDISFLLCNCSISNSDVLPILADNTYWLVRENRSPSFIIIHHSFEFDMACLRRNLALETPFALYKI